MRTELGCLTSTAAMTLWSLLLVLVDLSRCLGVPTTSVVLGSRTHGMGATLAMRGRLLVLGAPWLSVVLLGMP